MMLSRLWQSVNLLLLLVCLGSFYWAMRRFFRWHGREPVLARWVRALSFANLLALLMAFAVLPLPANRPHGQDVLATLVFILSFSVFWWSLRTNRTQPLTAIGSADAPMHLVQSGPYRFVRHPFYLSYTLAWFGAALGASTLWFLLPALVIACIYYAAARTEERKFAASAFANTYAAYAKRTGMLLPRITLI